MLLAIRLGDPRCRKLYQTLGAERDAFKWHAVRSETATSRRGLACAGCVGDACVGLVPAAIFGPSSQAAAYFPSIFNTLGASRFDFLGMPPEMPPLPRGCPRIAPDVAGRQNREFQWLFPGFFEISRRHWTSAEVYGVGTADHRIPTLSVCLCEANIFLHSTRAQKKALRTSGFLRTFADAGFVGPSAVCHFPGTKVIELLAFPQESSIARACPDRLRSKPRSASPGSSPPELSCALVTTLARCFLSRWPAS